MDAEARSWRPGAETQAAKGCRGGWERGRTRGFRSPKAQESRFGDALPLHAVARRGWKVRGVADDLLLEISFSSMPQMLVICGDSSEEEM